MVHNRASLGEVPETCVRTAHTAALVPAAPVPAQTTSTSHSRTEYGMRGSPYATARTHASLHSSFARTGPYHDCTRTSSSRPSRTPHLPTDHPSQVPDAPLQARCKQRRLLVDDFTSAGRSSIDYCPTSHALAYPSRRDHGTLFSSLCVSCQCPPRPRSLHPGTKAASLTHCDGVCVEKSSYFTVGGVWCDSTRPGLCRV